jgi:hypothetical protein
VCAPPFVTALLSLQTDPSADALLGDAALGIDLEL